MQADRAEALTAGLELALDAIFARDAQRRITFWNKGAQDTYGFGMREALGRQPKELLQTEYPLALERIERIVTDTGSWEGQLVQTTRDGRRLLVESRWAAQYDDDGTLVGLLEVNRVVAAKIAEQAAMLEHAPDAFVGVGEDGLIVLVNAQTEAMFGHHRQELIGRPLAVLVPERFHARHEAMCIDFFRHPRTRAMTDGLLYARRQDGREFPAEICLSSVKTANGPIALAAIRDVGERMAAEEERGRLRAQAERERLKNQLDQAHRLESLGQLAGGIAHDFNNLLAVIINYAAFVADDLERAEAGERWHSTRQDLQQVRLASERAAQLTHQLLAFARREVAQPEVVDVNDVVSDVEQLLRRTLGEHIELSCSAASELPAVLIDPGKLEQVLVNLAVNARDAMPQGGMLCIDTDSVELDREQVASRPGLEPGRYVRVRVSDTGCGMAPEVLERVFDPFFTTKAAGEGTGLGLATVYGIVKQAGGRAQVYSERGVGTTFTALLPATEQQRSERPQLTEEQTVAPGSTILLVEDEAPLLAVARRILVRAGYKVITAANGPEALAAVAAHAGEIDLLVSDVIMPQMHGPQLAARVREQCPSLPVLFMSGFAKPLLDSTDGLLDGASLIEKPFSAPALLAHVNRALAR